MKDQAQLTDEQFQAEVLELVGNEFGVDGMARYIRLNHSGRGDYTRDRHEWLDDRTIEEIIADSKTRAA